MYSSQSIHIKNMVCRRCVDTVTNAARSRALPLVEVRMGVAVFQEELTPEQCASFRSDLEQHGFEILESRQTKTIEAIKRLLRARAREAEAQDELKLSAYLSQQLNYEYSHLSKLFSEAEGLTIERYFALQRIERAKELLAYDEIAITEIAEALGFSSPAHFASSFKKETGMRPREFRKLTVSARIIP